MYFDQMSLEQVAFEQMSFLGKGEAAREKTLLGERCKYCGNWRSKTFFWFFMQITLSTSGANAINFSFP
jgi:hypothetical protein